MTGRWKREDNGRKSTRSQYLKNQEEPVFQTDLQGISPTCRNIRECLRRRYVLNLFRDNVFFKFASVGD